MTKSLNKYTFPGEFNKVTSNLLSTEKVLLSKEEIYVNIKKYGAQVNDETDDSEAWEYAVLDVKNGGTIVMPSGSSIVEKGIDLEGLKNISIIGQGSPEGGCAIKTGRSDGGPLINVKKSNGISLSGLELFNYGPPEVESDGVIDAFGSNEEATNFLSVERCLIVAQASVNSKIPLVIAPYGISHRFSHCIFQGGQMAILGRYVGAQYLNGLEIDACSFSGQASAPLWNLGQISEIHSCVFEPTVTGEALILEQENGISLESFEFHANEIADSTSSSGVTMRINGLGIDIHGNLFFSGTGEGTKTCIQLSGNVSSALIAANIFNNYKLGIDKNGQTGVSFGIGPNVYQTVGTHHNFTPAGTLYVES